MNYSVEIGDSLKDTGLWILANMSVEGIISLPALMVGFLVAIAIYNFKDSRKGLEIDASTVISQVIKVDSVLVAIFLVSLLPIFWPLDSYSHNVYTLPFLTLMYLIGLLILVQSLNRAFNWARSIETGTQNNFRASMRVQYLESLGDNEKRDAWEKIWQAADSTRKLIDERQLIKLFVTSVKKVKDKKSFASWLVQDLISVIDTVRTNDPVITQELVNFCLSNGFGFTEDDSSKIRQESGELRYAMNLRRLYLKILEKTLEKNDNSLFSFIDASRSYLKDSNLKEAQLIKVFAPNFFSLVEKHEDQNWIWETLPDDWKITLENLMDKNTGRTTFAWLNAYSKWLRNHTLITTNPAEFNTILDEATRQILPTSDPITWARLFAFHWSSYGVKDGESSEHAQVRNFIENHLTFGVMSNVLTYFFADNSEEKFNENIRSQVDEVLDIATKTTIFPWFHDKEVLKKYLNAVKEMKETYGDDEEKRGKAEWLEATLKDIQRRIKTANTVTGENRTK